MTDPPAASEESSSAAVAALQLTLLGLWGVALARLFDSAIIMLTGWVAWRGSLTFSFGAMNSISVLRVLPVAATVGFSVATVVGLWRLLASGAAGRRWPLAAALGYVAVAVGISLARGSWLLFELKLLDLSAALSALVNVGRLTALGGQLLAVVALTAMVLRGLRSAGQRVPRVLLLLLGLVSVWQFGFPLAVRLGFRPFSYGAGQMLLFHAIDGMTSTGLVVVLALLLGRWRRTLLVPPFAAHGARDNALTDPRWRSAAAGLQLYRAGIWLQLGINIFGLLVIRLAARSHDLEQVKSALVLTAVLSMVALLVPLTGLVRYCRVPEQSGARASARGALVIMVLVAALNLVTLVLIVRATSSSRLLALYDLARRQLPPLEGMTYLVGFIGFLALLHSLGAVARQLELKRYKRRMAVLMLAAPIMGLCLAALRLGARQLPVGLLLPLALLALVGSITVLLLYLGLVKGLTREIRSRLVG